MGKTVKSRTMISITCILCVIALCIWANSGVPSLYKSYKERVVAQAANSRVTHQISRPAADTPAAAAEEPAAEETPADDFTTDTSADVPTEDANVYEIEEPVQETSFEEDTPAEEPAAEEEEPMEEPAEEQEPEAEKTFLEKVVDFITSMFETVTSGNLLEKLKEFFSGIFGKLGISL